MRKPHSPHDVHHGEAASPPLLERNGARATIRLNRPRHLNRLQAEDLDVLLKLFGEIEADPAIRVVVLTGTGRAFSAGYDLGSIANRAAAAQQQTAGSAFEVVVRTDALPEDLRPALTAEPLVLPAWDPMGALA